MEEENKEMKSFKDLGLSEQLVEACEKFGWKNPKEIQTEVIPLALQGKDVIGISNTGSGKTGAFVLPILHALAPQPHLNNFFACVMSPTRELGIQIAEQFEALGSEIGVKCAVLVGGTSMVQQSIDIAKRPHIIVGTPGRLLDHLKHTKGFSLGRLKYLVLDEADRLLNEDFEKELNEILGFIPSKRRTFLFSATGTDKIYIHRVGRTARAGRSGVAISLLNQYELSWFRQIEEHMDKKLPCDEVMLLKERVDTAKRLAEKEIKKSGEKKKWRGEGDLGEEDENIDKYLGLFSSRKKKILRSQR